MTERRERDRVVAASERDIDAQFRPLARGVGQAVRRHCRDGMTALCRAMVLRDADALLDGAFGRYPGDPNSPLTNRVAGRAREARVEAFRLQLARLGRSLPTDLRRAVGIADGR